MKLLQRIGYLLVVAVLLVQCKSKEAAGEFDVAVKYKEADKLSPMPGRKLLLEEIPFGPEAAPLILDSASLKDNAGSITLKGKAKEAGLYQLTVENGPVLVLVNDAENIQVDLDLSKHDRFYTVSGSEGSEQLRDFIQQYTDRSASINNIFSRMDSLKQTGAPDSVLLAVTEEKNKAIASITDYLKGFISKSSNPAVSLFALGISSRVFSKTDFETALSQSLKKFPEHGMLKSMKQTFDMQQAQMAEMEKQKAARSLIGKEAPDLTMPDPNGKNISIRDFRGKYVLVDFWASWCAPCRQENPNVVRAYDKFRNKNFTILGVSLDKEKGPWEKAISADKLIWSHMSDLKFWESESVKAYGFEGIPYNVLIDPSGKVIAENLRGFDLEQKLSEVLP